MKICAAGGYLTIWYCLANIIKTHSFNNKIRELVNLHMLHGIINEQGH